MKSLLMLFLGLCAVALVWADGEKKCADSISEQCPIVDGPDAIFLPVPENCRQYCECSDGIAWLFECAPGTLFDTEEGLCDWEATVDCGGRPIPIPGTTPNYENSEEEEEELKAEEEEYDSW